MLKYINQDFRKELRKKDVDVLGLALSDVRKEVRRPAIRYASRRFCHIDTCQLTGTSWFHQVYALNRRLQFLRLLIDVDKSRRLVLVEQLKRRELEKECEGAERCADYRARSACLLSIPIQIAGRSAELTHFCICLSRPGSPASGRLGRSLRSGRGWWSGLGRRRPRQSASSSMW